MTTSAHEWLDAFAARLGVALPSDEERATILTLAGTAAHASERAAAPVACWLAAAAGWSAHDAAALALELDALTTDEDDGIGA